ncbi:hypothetical protein GQ53DRAFT_850187 [Thozetella sp. PMI_491]|nr:hypothetical protein GQ53DRAFT_850187 [Thozetella sp. PMI_491]
MAELQEMLSTGSSFSATPTDSSNVASTSSTPPTTASPDNMSLASEPDGHKPDAIAPPSGEQDASRTEQMTLIEDVQESITSAHTADAVGSENRASTPVNDAIAVATSPASRQSPGNADTPSSQAAARPRRARASEPVYNISKLLGTDHHGKRRANGDIVGNKRRSVSGHPLAPTGDLVAGASTDRLLQDSLNALDMNWSLAGPATPKGLRPLKKAKSTTSIAADPVRRATRQSGVAAETLATKLSTLSKRGRKTFEKSLSRMSRELRRLQDTNEYAHIDERPVRHTVWSNGKYIDPNEIEEEEEESPPKRVKMSDAAPSKDVYEIEEDEQPPEPAPRAKPVKKYLDKGLYAGQKAPSDPFKYLTPPERKKLAANPDLIPKGSPNKVLPMPIFNGFRELLNGRDFKLPRSVMNPLPAGQPKPPPYRTLTKNRFIGDASAIWKKSRYAQDSSTCICKPEDGCGEDCQNRIMLYECDDRNCNVGRDRCMNRAFQDLSERTKKGGQYRIGVDVFKTGDRGFGVRSNRSFAPGQIIMEYTGEIITVDECERRMNEEYKDNECYYLMSFDQNMIIDATTGSAARFVNHSCLPNCRMIKWIVSGQPRMALFAGDYPIHPGDELTYDYNFDPFSLKNVQKCLCGSANCRGVLGPKSKEVKKPEDKKMAKGAKASPKGKRKLKDLLAGDKDDEDAAKSAKKRKVKPATGLKRSLSSASLKVAKGAATVIKRSVSSITIKSKKAKGSPASTKQSSVYKRQSSTSIVKSYSKSPAGKTPPKSLKVTASRRASYTIVAAGASGKGAKSKPKASPAKATPKTIPKTTPKTTPKARPKASSGKSTPKAASPAASLADAPSSRKRTPSRKILESADSLSNVTAAASKSPKSPKPRKGLDLARKQQIRLVQDE